MASHQFNTTVNNEILGCPNCKIPIYCGSSESQVTVKSTLSLKLLSKGDYYVQCSAYLYDFISENWPNKIIEVHSKILKVQAFNNQSEGMKFVSSDELL